MKYIIGYKPGLKSVRELRRFPGIRSIRHRGSTFRPSPNKTVVNWGGCSRTPILDGCTVINHPDFVAKAANKLSAFQEMTTARTVPWTTDKQYAMDNWLLDVVCRKKLRGKGGDGIVMVTTMEEIVDAPLYTKYTKSKSEWRVHIYNNRVIQTSRKVRNPDVPVEEVDWKIRNHDRGFIFQRNNENIPQDVIDQSLLAIRDLSLHFGAVDVLYNERYNQAYVLEVNCAPNLEGSLVELYANAINSS